MKAKSPIINRIVNRALKESGESSFDENHMKDVYESNKISNKPETQKPVSTPGKVAVKPKENPKSTNESKLLDGLYKSFSNPIPREKAFKVQINIESYRFDNNKYFQLLHEENNRVKKLVKNNVLPDGKIQNFYDNNIQEVIFPNGAKRQTFPNGYSIVNFVNKDIKQTLPDNTIIYYYAEHDTTQITLPKEKTEVQ